MRARTRPSGIGLRRKALREAEEFEKESRLNGQCVEGSSKDKWNCASYEEYIPLPLFTPRAASFIIATVSLLCYWNSCNGDFVFDDSEAIENNKDILPESSLLNLFVHDFWGGNLAANDSHKSYRPLTVLTFRVNYWLSGGLSPWGFHFVNVILHSLVSILSLRVFDEVFENYTPTAKVSRQGFLSALIFAVHPIHTESVAGIVGRADLLCALCFFVSFLVYIKCCRLYNSHHSQSALGYLLLSVLLCGLAMLFKEQGITVLNNKISLYGGLFYRQSILALVGIALLLGRWNVMGSAIPLFQVSDNPASFEESFIARLRLLSIDSSTVDTLDWQVINYNYIYGINLWILVCPWWLCFDWSMGCIPLIKSPTDPRILAVFLMWGVVVALLGYCLFGVPSRYRRICTMGLAFIVVPFLPASNVFFRVGFVVAERVLYLSSVGSCILVVLGITALSRKASLRKVSLCCVDNIWFVICGIFAMLACFALWTIKRNGQWLDEDSLFTSGQAVCPLNAKVHYNIGKVRSNQHNDEEALRYYRQAVRLNPTYHDALNNLGNLLKEKGEIKEAEELLERAVKSSHTFAAGWMNLGTVKAAMNKMEESERCYLNAIRFRKKFPDAYFNLGNLYIDWDRSEEAIVAFKNAVRLKKTHVGAWLNHILLLDKSEKREEGVALAKEALKYIPNEGSIHFNLGNMLGQEGNFEEAEKHFFKSIKINPQVAEVQGNL
ncbi:hypothetical protein QZH41_015084, partial [Actinostola sp. cb2023]